MRIRPALSLLVLSAVLALPLPSLALGTIDQQQDTWSGIQAYEVTPDGESDTSVAQTFTAAISGQLDRVSLMVALADADGSADLTVEIWDTIRLEGGNFVPGVNVLASQTIPNSQLSTTMTWLHVDFVSPATVSGATCRVLAESCESEYAIVVRESEAPAAAGETTSFLVAAESDDPYPRGRAFLRHRDSPYASYGADLVFETFVTVGEEPKDKDKDKKDKDKKDKKDKA